MPIKILDILLFILLWALASGVAIFTAMTKVDSIAADFGGIALLVMTVTSTFMAAVMFLPTLYNWNRNAVAIGAALAIIAFVLLTNFWLADIIPVLK